jgi:hypothetical protein
MKQWRWRKIVLAAAVLAIVATEVFGPAQTRLGWALAGIQLMMMSWSQERRAGTTALTFVSPPSLTFALYSPPGHAILPCAAHVAEEI